MKYFLFLIALLVGLLPAVEPPKTHPSTRYYPLHNNSAITDKPVIEAPDEGPNDLENWVLVGLKEYVTGKVATIVNKKDPKVRLQVPGHTDEEKEFTLLEVKKGVSSYLETTVLLRKGPHQGTVGFDPKYLVIRRAAPAKTTSPKKPTSTTRNTTATGKSPLPTSAKPATTSSTTTRKAPRQRFIPKPTK
ncbi:MAG: hypothetical protein ACON5H_02750 [Akkermansiaceae bacterium]